MASPSTAWSIRGGQPRILRVAVGLAVVLALLVVLGLAVGRAIDMRYLNIPVLHPYPPSGYVQNPFNPSDRADLIRVADAAKVKADLLADGNIEIEALGAGNASPLAGATTGRALTAATNVIEANNRAGVVERDEVNLQTVVVGHLRDPNDASGAISWCVEEQGNGTITMVSASTSQTASSRRVSFVNRFWMVNLGGRWLIADAEVNAS